MNLIISVIFAVSLVGYSSSKVIDVIPDAASVKVTADVIPVEIEPLVVPHTREAILKPGLVEIVEKVNPNVQEANLKPGLEEIIEKVNPNVQEAILKPDVVEIIGKVDPNVQEAILKPGVVEIIEKVKKGVPVEVTPVIVKDSVAARDSLLVGTPELVETAVDPDVKAKTSFFELVKEPLKIAVDHVVVATDHVLEAVPLPVKHAVDSAVEVTDSAVKNAVEHAVVAKEHVLGAVPPPVRHAVDSAVEATDSVLQTVSKPLKNAVDHVVVHFKDVHTAAEEKIPVLVDLVTKPAELKVVDESLVKVAREDAEVFAEVAPVSAEVEKSDVVAERISDSVSSSAKEGVSVPVSAIPLDKETVVPLVEEDCVKEPLEAEIKDTLVKVNLPVTPSVTVPSPDVVSVLSSRNTEGAVPERFAYKSDTEKLLFSVDDSKNIFRTEKGDLVKLEIIGRSSAKPEEKPLWVQVAPLPYPPKSIMRGDAPEVFHYNAKFKSIPAISPVETPKPERAARKFRYSQLRANPRARFGMNPAVDQQTYVGPAIPDANSCSENGRCFWPFVECLYDMNGYAIYCW